MTTSMAMRVLRWAMSLLLPASLAMGTSLHDAVQSDDVDAVARVVALGGDIEEGNSVGHRPLHVAKSVTMARWLIEAGAELEALSDKGYTPLMLAAVVAPPAVVSYLAQAGADVRARNPKTGFTVLHYLAWSEGREALAEQMIAAGAEVDARNNNLRTPLHVAAGNLIVPLAKLLLDHGADPDALDEEGMTPLMLPLRRFGLEGLHTDFIDLYFDSEFNPNTRGPTGLTVLHLAAARDKMRPLVTRLIELGADMEAGAELPGYDVSGFRPLHAAAWLGMGKTVETLLDHGADIEARSSDGRTALHWAASPLREGFPKTVFLVSEMIGVLDTNHPFKQTGQGPVRKHLRKDGLPAVRILIERGALPSTKDNSGRTPLEAAQEAGYKETVAFFRDLARL